MADKTVLLALKITGDDDGASKSLNSVGTASSSASSKMQKAGAVAGKVLAVGLVAAGAAAIAATKAAAEDEAAQAKLATALQKNAGATKEQVAQTEAWITAQGKQLGVADDELRPALGKLVTVTKDVGEAQKLASLAMDISAGSGKSLESVTQGLSRAMATGSTAGLAKYGVSMLNAKGETVSMEVATKRLAASFEGQAAKAAQTTAGQTKILQVQMGELQETIGAKLLPVMLKLAQVGIATIDWMTEHSTITKVVAASLAGLLVTVYAVGKAIALWSTITKVATGVQAAFNIVMAANPIVLIVAAIALLVVGLVVAYKKSETFRNIVNGAFNAVKTVVVGTVKAVVGFVKSHWKLLLVILTGPFGLAVVGITKYGGKIKSVVTGVVKAVVGFVKDNWRKGLLLLLTGPFGLAILFIRSKADAIRAKVRSMVTAVVDFVRDRWRDIASIVSSAFGRAKDAVSRVASAIVSFVRDKFSALVGFVRSFMGNAVSAAASGAQRLRDAIVNRVVRVISFFQGLPDRIVRALGSLSRILYNAGADLIGGLKDGIVSGFGAIQDELSGLKDKIVGWKGPPNVDKVLLTNNGKLLMQGLERGIDSGAQRVKSKLRKLQTDIRKSIAGTTAPPVELVTPTSMQSQLGQLGARDVRVVNITVQGAVDVASTARQIRDLLNRESLWRGRVVVSS